LIICVYQIPQLPIIFICIHKPKPYLYHIYIYARVCYVGMLALHDLRKQCTHGRQYYMKRRVFEVKLQYYIVTKALYIKSYSFYRHWCMRAYVIYIIYVTFLIYVSKITPHYMYICTWTANRKTFYYFFSSKILKYDYLNRWHFEKFVNYNTI
jgi:hypothetical protein